MSLLDYYLIVNIFILAKQPVSQLIIFWTFIIRTAVCPCIRSTLHVCIWRWLAHSFTYLFVCFEAGFHRASCDPELTMLDKADRELLIFLHSTLKSCCYRFMLITPHILIMPSTVAYFYLDTYFYKIQCHKMYFLTIITNKLKRKKMLQTQM